jgi:hypothetical protein
MDYKFCRNSDDIVAALMERKFCTSFRGIGKTTGLAEVLAKKYDGVGVVVVVLNEVMGRYLLDMLRDRELLNWKGVVVTPRQDNKLAAALHSGHHIYADEFALLPIDIQQLLKANQNFMGATGA